MSVAAPINRKAIENAIRTWFLNATGLAAVDWANQPTGAPQAALPYATLFNLTPAVKLGQDEIRIRDASGDDPMPDAGSEIELALVGLRKMTISCNVYSKSNDPDLDARAIMDKAHAALSLPSFSAALQTAGLSVIDDGAVRSLDAVESDKFIARAQLDVTFGLASNAKELIGYIAQIMVTESAELGAPFTIEAAMAQGFTIVSTIAQRNALSPKQTFMWVLVRNNNAIYQLGADGSTWRFVKRLPDLTLLDELDGYNANAIRYVAGTGSDDTGDGTLAKPYRDIQRCADSIPEGCEGTLTFMALDAGPFHGCAIPDLKAGANGLAVRFHGAGDPIIDLNAAPAGSLVANPTGGFKAMRVKYAGAGAHGAFTNGSHWVRGQYTFLTGYVSVVAAVIDGENSPSPDVSVVTGPVDQFLDIKNAGYQILDIRPHVSLFEQDADSGTLSISVKAQVGTTIAFIGFCTDAAFVSLAGAVNMAGFASRNAASTLVINLHGAEGAGFTLYNAGFTWLRGEGANEVAIAGLFKKTVRIAGVVCSVAAIIRTTDNTKLHVAYVSDGGPQIPSAANVSCDFEGASQVCVQGSGAGLRFYDDGYYCTTDGASVQFLIARARTFINLREDAVACIFGSTTGLAVSLQEGSQARGFLGHGATPALRGTGVGNDIAIGSITQAFSAIAVTKTDVLAANPQFCRAT